MSGAAKSTENYETIQCLLENADRTVLGRGVPIDDETKGALRFTAMKPLISRWQEYMLADTGSCLQETIKEICLDKSLLVKDRAAQIEEEYNKKITSTAGAASMRTATPWKYSNASKITQQNHLGCS